MTGARPVAKKASEASRHRAVLLYGLDLRTMKFRCPNRVLSVAALLLVACGSPDARVVAREPADRGAIEPAPRGRVRVVGGVLVSDRGTPLRGVTISVDVDPDFAFDAPLFDELARSTGLNAIHTYAENWQQVTGEREAVLDRLVDLTGSTGLYLIIAIGGGSPGDGHPGNGWFDIEKVRSFWTHYGARYADRTHVIYEIQNNPELGCDAVLAQATLDMEREAYALLRSVAPQTHVFLFSFEAVPTAAALTATIAGVADVVNFSNASVSMHGTPVCVPPESFPAVRDAAFSLRVPAMATELEADFAPYVRVLEASGIGWTHRNWLNGNRDLVSFRQANVAAGISWCPDFGTWPEDRARCAR